MTYEEAKTYLDRWWKAFFPDIGDIWFDQVKIHDEDISPAVWILFPFNSASGVERTKEGFIGGMKHAAETGIPMGIERDVLPMLVVIVDQIDPDTAPGELFISKRLRTIAKEYCND